MIYHESQRLRLCGQHTINSLVQQPAFDQKELTSIANSLLSAEKSLHKNRQIPERNPYFSILGDFSIVVIEEALKKHHIQLLRCATDVTVIQNTKAYVIQNNDHWFTLRRFGDHWFELNSMRSQPVLIPEFYIYDYVNRLEGEFTVFIVDDCLPNSNPNLLEILPEKEMLGDPSMKKKQTKVSANIQVSCNWIFNCGNHLFLSDVSF